MSFNWFSLIRVVAMAALGSNPRTAPIANEVSDAIVEAEQLHGGSNGAAKLEHVINIAKAAAQATDELRGGSDDVAGPVTVAVNAAVAATNQAVKVFHQPFL